MTNGMEAQSDSAPGIHFDEIFARIEELARDSGDPAPIRSEVEKTAAEAVRNGFVEIVPSGSNSPAPRYVATDDFYDMSLFMDALEGFDSMVAGARVDGRFFDLFEELEGPDFWKRSNGRNGNQQASRRVPLL